MNNFVRTFITLVVLLSIALLMAQLEGSRKRVDAWNHCYPEEQIGMEEAFWHPEQYTALYCDPDVACVKD